MERDSSRTGAREGERQANGRRGGWSPPRGRDERYEAQPSLTRLPGWAWRRLPVAGKLLVALLPFAVVALVLLLGPGIRESKDERAQAERERIERNQAARAERLRAEQRPRFASGSPAPDSEAGRARLVDGAARAVDADARTRVAAGTLDGPIRGVGCEPYPRTESRAGADQDLSQRYGRYACLAATAEFTGNASDDARPYASSEAGAIGHPYRVRIDFDSGRFAFCKVSGRAGEGGLRAEPVVTVPRVCGG